MPRRDQVLLTTPLSNEANTAFAYEPVIELDVANRRMKVGIRLSGPARKFVKSLSADLVVTDAALNTFMNFVHSQAVAAFPMLAGVKTVVEVPDADADPVIG